MALARINRRDFFCALAALAAARGVLPVGWLEELREPEAYDVYAEWEKIAVDQYIYGKAVYHYDSAGRIRHVPMVQAAA